MFIRKKTKIVGFLLNQPGFKAFHVLWENDKYLTKTPQFERFTDGPPKFEQYEQRTLIFKSAEQGEHSEQQLFGETWFHWAFKQHLEIERFRIAYVQLEKSF